MTRYTPMQTPPISLLDLLRDAFDDFDRDWDDEAYILYVNVDRVLVGAERWVTSVPPLLDGLWHSLQAGDVPGACFLVRTLHESECELREGQKLSPSEGPLSGALWETSDLVCHVDSLLATLERGETARALARACRRDVNALGVFADWCDEHGRPAGASELRYLQARARVLVRHHETMATYPERSWERSFSEAEDEDETADPDVE
jgi:hypothetical protein